MTTNTQNLVEPKESNMGSFFSKFFSWQKNVVDDSSGNQLQKVPGSLGFTLFNVLGLVISGHHFYVKRRDNESSNIFKVCIYQNRIVLCSYDAIRHLYESPYVMKEPSFGMMTFNFECLDNYTPLIFKNGEVHNERRKMYIELSKTLFCNENFIDNLHEIAGIEMQQLATKFAEHSENFERSMAKAVGNIIFESIVGTRIEYDLLESWMNSCLIKKFKSADPDSASFYEKIRDTIKASEKFQKLCDHVINKEKIDVTDTSICNDMIFSLIFNAHAALNAFACSSLAHLSNLSTEDLNLLKSEATRFHQSSDKTTELNNLPNIENYAMEMLRLFPPATFVFRRATQNFVISLKTGDYQINKGDLLSGNVYLCNRDPDIFDNPDEIDIHRYKTAPNLKEYLTSFGTNFVQENTPVFHKCAGQKLAMTIAKVLVVHCLFFDAEHACEVTWSGKYIKRFIGSDKPLKIKTLHYNHNNNVGEK